MKALQSSWLRHNALTHWPSNLFADMQVVDDILSVGYDDHSEFSTASATWKTDDALLHEDRTAFRITKQARQITESSGSSNCIRRA